MHMISYMFYQVVVVSHATRIYLNHNILEALALIYAAIRCQNIYFTYYTL